MIGLKKSESGRGDSEMGGKEEDVKRNRETINAEAMDGSSAVPAVHTVTLIPTAKHSL